MDNIQLGTIIAAIVGLVGLLKQLQYLYEVVFQRPRQEIEAQINMIKNELDEKQRELSLRVREIEEYKILSNARHEHTQRMVEKLEIKMDELTDKVEIISQTLNDKFNLLVDLIKQRI